MHKDNKDNRAGDGDDRYGGRGADKVRLVQAKVEEVRRDMQENVDAALANNAKAEAVARAAEELVVQADCFRVGARELQRKLWWRQMRMRLAVAAFVLVVVGVVVGVAVAVGTAK